MVKRILGGILALFMTCLSLAFGILRVLLCIAIIQHPDGHTGTQVFLGLLGTASWALVGLLHRPVHHIRCPDRPRKTIVLDQGSPRLCPSEALCEGGSF